MKTYKLIILSILLWSVVHLDKPFAQPNQHKEAFSQMSMAQRYNFLHTLPFSTVDSSAFMALYTPLMAVAIEKKDAHAAWVLQYIYFFRRDELKLSLEDIFKILRELEEKAKASGWMVEQEVAEYYTQYIKYKNALSPYEQNYAFLIRRYERMEDIGFDKFKDYSIVIMMFHSGEFMYELADYEKALQFIETYVFHAFVSPNQKSIVLFIR